MGDGLEVDRHSGNRKPSITIYDVARATGVSPSTVSRALNKPGRINEATEKRIRAAADELGYRINPMARSLLTGRTGTLALVLSDYTNPVYFELVRGAERVATDAGFTLVLTESQESSERELQAAERLQPAVDGIMLVASRLTDDEIRHLAEVKPLVPVNRVVDGLTSVVPDLTQGVGETLNHLESLGHHSIGYLSGPPASWMNAVRWRALFDQAVRRGMSIVELGPSDPTRRGGADMLARVRAAGVSVIVAYNDLMAIGLLQACKAVGVVVPDELSIVGFDDIFGADLTTPSLTTVRSPVAEIGEEAVRLLLEQISPDRIVAAPARLSTELVVRESTAAPFGH